MLRNLLKLFGIDRCSVIVLQRSFCIHNAQNHLTYALPLVFIAPESTHHQLHIVTHLQSCSDHCTTTKSRSGQGQHARVLYSSGTGCLAWFIHECMLWNCPSSFIHRAYSNTRGTFCRRECECERVKWNTWLKQTRVTAKRNINGIAWYSFWSCVWNVSHIT